jgi:hypothetical protein
MTELAMLLMAVCALAFGCSFVRIGKYAVLSQDRFLQFCARGPRRKEVMTDRLPLESFGEPVSLRLLGVGLVAIGLFIVVSVSSFVLICIAT